MEKEKLKQYVGLIVFTILIFVLLINFEKVLSVIAYIWDLFFPFVLGGAIAFIINILMTGIEKLLHRLDTDNKFRKAVRPVSLILSFVIIIAVIAVIIGVVMPILVQTIKSIGTTAMEELPKLHAWALNYFANQPEILKLLNMNEIDWNALIQGMQNFFFNGAGGDLLSHTFNATVGIISGVSQFFIALVFACYILLQKERLHNQFWRVMKVCFKKNTVKKAHQILSLSNRTFSNFITGQCLEACILGTLFLITMLILRLPYALLISILIAFTALIPIVGAFIGCAVGALLILMVNPLQALIFVIVFLVLQQIEGNLIYPHVVGGSIGLPSMWVLVAVCIGGNLIGIAGILLFIPLSSVLYTLFKNWVKEKERAQEPG